MLFVGGSRAHHYQDLFTDIGMKVDLGRATNSPTVTITRGGKVLPTIKVDADSRNIEEIARSSPTRWLSDPARRRKKRHHLRRQAFPWVITRA